MITSESLYDKKTFCIDLLILVLMIPLQMFMRGNGFLLVLPFALLSLARKRPEVLFFWIMLSIALMTGNGFLMPKSFSFYLGQRFLFAVVGVYGAMSMFARRQCFQIKPLLFFLSYIIYAIIPSIQGWAPVVSILKLILFTIVFFAYFGLSNMVVMDVRTDIRKIRSVFLAFAVFYIIGSFILLPFPAIGQLTGEEYEAAILQGRQVVSLFKGMAIHSQALGPILAFIIILLFADMCFYLKRNYKLYDLLIFIGALLIYKTSSRAAMATLILGLLFVAWEMMRARGIGTKWRSKVISIFMVLSMIGLMLIIAVPTLRDGAARFALKYKGDAITDDVTMENMTSSRQGLMDAALFHWRKKPLIGNGFQVSDQMLNFDSNDWRHLISAPIEKGVWVTAVLEEGGGIGFALICMFIITVGFIMLNRRVYIGLAMLFSLFVSNMAEFTMFSMSGMGGLIWALVFIGCVFDAVRIRDEQRHGGMFPMGLPQPYPPPPYAF